MASQGLFTQGITVDDLLKKRSIRSQQQQQLMADQAAQGARDPQRARMGSMFGSIIGKALGDNAGGADSEMEKLKASNAQQESLQQQYGQEIMSGTPESNIKMGGELIKLGYGDYGGKLLQKGQAGMVTKQDKLRNQKRRESLIEVAGGMGLTTQVEMLQGGGDLEEAAKFIRNQREIQIAQDSGKQGQMALASTYNKGPAFMKKVANGDFTGMDGVEYTALLKGKKADLQSFVNSEGISSIHSVDETGMVFDSETNTWLNPSELGLNLPSDGDAERLKTEFDQTSKLRKEISADLNVIQYKKSKIEFRKILTSAKAGTAQGDLALIFSYMRMLDPASTVRESEFEQAEKARGLGEKFFNMFIKVKDGQKMGQEQREGFVKVARSLYQNVKELAQPKYDQIRELVIRNELNEQDVFGSQTEREKISTKFETIDMSDMSEAGEEAVMKIVSKLSTAELKLYQTMLEQGDI